MANRMIALMVALTLGLIAFVWVLNTLWMRAFGGGGVGVPQQVSREEQVADRTRLREENSARQAEKFARERHSPEALRAAASSGVPTPLSKEDYDPRSGQVRWPEVLRAGAHDALRGEIEMLLARMASEPADEETKKQAHAKVEELFGQLRERIREVPTGDYLVARRFIESLIFMLRP